jgi:hypothetical protein
MIAGGEVHATQLLHLHPPARCAEVERQPLQRDDAVAEAVQVRVLALDGSRHVIDEQHRDVAPGEELLQPKDLPTIA